MGNKGAAILLIGYSVMGAMLLFYQVETKKEMVKRPPKAGVSLIILGTLQDGGAPHIGCKKECCQNLFNHPDPSRKVVSLGIIDALHRQTWLIEATPDIAAQLQYLKKKSAFKSPKTPNGIFITHAHIGHYAGLMYLGKEAMACKSIPVFVMPRMKAYLENNGPWSQLVSQKNIIINPLFKDSVINLSQHLSITPFLVPHRDEFSETVGYVIEGPHKKVLFIPDINKWSLWKKNIVNEIAKVDYAFIDATFYSGSEINTRNISEIPHPFVIETMTLLNPLPASEKNKIYFIHLNHTNPLLNGYSSESIQVHSSGFHVALFGQMFDL